MPEIKIDYARAGEPTCEDCEHLSHPEQSHSQKRRWD